MARRQNIIAQPAKEKLMLWVWWLYSGGVALVLLGFLLDAFSGLPKLADLARPEWDRRESNRLRVRVIVPALNEEKGIEACLRSLAGQDYSNLEVIAVNDRSSDSTGAIMDRIAATSGGRLRVLHLSELPPGWLGKPHAMWSAAKLVTGDWLLFTDGDVVFQPGAIRRAVTYAETARTDHLSLLPTLLTKSVGERMMISLFHFGLVAMRPWQSPAGPSRFAFGAGAFNMLRRSAYQQIGTSEALRMEVVEDLALAQRVKRAGLISCVVLAPGLVSLHWASGAMGIVRTLTKNGYAVIGFRWYIAALFTLIVLAFHVAPFVLMWLAPGSAKLGFALCVGCIFCFYLLFRRVTGINPAYFLLHPIGALLSAYALLRSVVLTTVGGGVVWRGTKYSLHELRRAAASRTAD